LNFLPPPHVQGAFSLTFGPSRRTDADHSSAWDKWRIQELAEGGLSELARRKIAELARNAPIRRRLVALVPSAETASGVVLPALASAPVAAHPMEPAPPRHRDARLPPPGTVFRRMHNEVAHDVSKRRCVSCLRSPSKAAAVGMMYAAE
jgi:hypothetical protein